MAIIGIMRQSSQESEDYARINNRVTELESDIDNAIYVNREFDDTAGFWQQVKFDGFTDDAVIVHKKISTENYNNLEVTPHIITQSLVSYSADSGQNFTRITDSYHELVVNGEANVTSDTSSPNFTPMGISAFNKTKGNVGVGGLTVRVDDVHYPDSVLGELGASKSCGIGTIVSRRADYSQGRHRASYSIGVEGVVVNLAEEDGIEGTDGYYGNPENWAYDTWTNIFHGVGGGRRPITAGILLNGKQSAWIEVDSSGKPVKDAQGNAIIENGTARTLDHYEHVWNGMYNGIYIGASAMRVRSTVSEFEKIDDKTYIKKWTYGNSPHTVGINTSNWTENGPHGFTFLKAGYAPRILISRGSALFEAPGVKFLNPNGYMPVAISCVDEYTDSDNVTHKGTPYLDFKLGTTGDFYENGIPKERPADTTHSRIGYVSTSSSMNVSSDGDIKFNVSRDFSDSSTTGKIYTMTETDFSPSSAVNLGTANKKWDNIYANADVITTSDRNLKEDIKDIDEKILRAWSKVNYKVFKFKNGSRKHIGVIAQDIDEAFRSEGLNARDFGLFCEDTDENGNTILGVRYSECLALECAYIRSKLGA